MLSVPASVFARKTKRDRIAEAKRRRILHALASGKTTREAAKVARCSQIWVKQTKAAARAEFEAMTGTC